MAILPLCFTEHAAWDWAESFISIRAVHPQWELVVGGSGWDQRRGGAAHIQTALPQRQPEGAAADAAGQTSRYTGEIMGPLLFNAFNSLPVVALCCIMGRCVTTSMVALFKHRRSCSSTKSVCHSVVFKQEIKNVTSSHVALQQVCFWWHTILGFVVLSH